MWESKALWPPFPVKLDAQFPKEFSPLKHQTVFSNIVTKNDCAILRLIERCSSLYKLKRLMAWLLRCKTKFFRRTKISKFATWFVFKKGLLRPQAWAQVQFLSNQFWCRWVNEFMPNLTQRQKWFQPERNVQVGDVVLLAESMQQRSKWVMGRVLETYPDKHGKVRTVILKTSGSTMKRPIAKLCVILSESAC